MKKLDGMPLGSSSLWGARALKGYGMLPESRERSSELELMPKFNYSTNDVAMAGRIRTNFYERLLNPHEISIALRYSPVSLDIEIFSSVWSDQAGILTLPDTDDMKEEFDHCVTVYGHDENGIFVDTNWPSWGPNNGHGYISFDYLETYFITAFALIAFDHMVQTPIQQILVRKKIRIKDKRWYMNIFAVPSMRGDARPIFNMEINNAGGTIAGWTHFCLNDDKTIEILDLFVLPEYRLRGVGSFMFKESQAFLGARRVRAYIASHDLIGTRDDEIKDFLIFNEYLPFPDRSQFKDCRYRIEPLQRD